MILGKEQPHSCIFTNFSTQPLYSDNFSTAATYPQYQPPYNVLTRGATVGYEFHSLFALPTHSTFSSFAHPLLLCLELPTSRLICGRESLVGSDTCGLLLAPCFDGKEGVVWAALRCFNVTSSACTKTPLAAFLDHPTILKTCVHPMHATGRNGGVAE